jgi:hypothetical protein
LTFRRRRFDILLRFTVKYPSFRVFAQMCVNPRKSNVSGFPSPRFARFSDSGEPNEHSDNALLHIAFPIVQQGRHSRTVISELNTAPMHTPANASPRHYWSSRHSSGPERIANPYSVEDLAQSLTSYFMPVLTGAFWTSPRSRPRSILLKPTFAFTEMLFAPGTR